MPVVPGSLGGRDDVVLPADLPDLGRWQPLDGMYLEASEIGDADEFPRRGHFLLVQLLDGDGDLDEQEVYAAVTEGLDGMLVEAMEAEDAGLTDLTVAVDTAEKAGSEETSPWRYSASIVPAADLGPPQD